MTRFAPLFSPIFATACAMAITGPAFAEDRKPAVEPVAAQAPATLNPKQRICFRDALTGSRILRTECKTRAEWTKLGVKTPAR